MGSHRVGHDQSDLQQQQQMYSLVLHMCVYVRERGTALGRRGGEGRELGW